ncbi:DNA independent RNA polymerase I transcription factor, partial [Spiromyces aspiralis]
SYTTNALQQVKKGHTAEYHELVKLFLWSRPTATFNRLDQQQQQQQQRSSEDQAQQLLPWLPALSENVSRLDLTYHALVSAIVCNNWMSNSIPEFYAKYRTLVLQIITAQPAWIPEIIRALVSWFFYRSTRASAGRADTQVVHSRVHELLQKIFALVPTAPSSLYTAIHSAFPHKREKFSRQKLYLTNVLRALEYTPSIRRSVLGLIFDRILQIDVEIQVEVEELELGQHTDLPSADNYDEPPNSPQDGDIFELELDSGAPPPPLSPSLAQLSN